MKIIEKAIEELREYENNPRHNENAVGYVANSISEFGFLVPIVVDANDVIVAGHTRYRAALRLGLDFVPCIVADDLSEEQVTAFRLADNKVAELAGWDFAALDRELAEILGLDMSAFGFEGVDDYNIDDLFEGESNKSKEKPPRTCRCPHCGSVVEV